MDATTLDRPVRYRVTGMDCSSCAAKIEGAARKLPGIDDVRVSIASQEMTLKLGNKGTSLPELERTITDLGYQLTKLGADDDDDTVPDLFHVTPAYKRALWIVILLNAGYGMIEVVGGFLADSQSLKADALDFLGDGLISFLGLIAIRWGLQARARAALLQGSFLAALGVGVIALTAYRVLVLNQPQAELMGIFGAVALVTNIAAALVLLPHRTGDANMRAVWLFSRNDAIGNAAVVVAAGLVWWTVTPWPDLAVAAIIGALFLQSAWSIIGHARADLRQAKRTV